MALLGLAAAVPLIACGGGSGGSVKYAPSVVPIKHLNLSGVDLTYKEFLQPPFASQYPAVVATVNGKPVSGDQLAREQVQLELGRRQWKADYPEVFGRDYAKAQLKNIESTDPLEAAIDEVLRSQAVERLGLLPTHDEAVVYTREQETYSEQVLAHMSPDERAQEIDMLRQQGFPETNWASADKIVQFYQGLMGLTRLENKLCKYETPVQAPTLAPGTLGFVNIFRAKSCAAFLAQERKRADIVYYVRWAD